MIGIGTIEIIIVLSFLVGVVLVLFDQELTTVEKFLWLAVVIFLNIIGLAIYLIKRFVLTKSQTT